MNELPTRHELELNISRLVDVSPQQLYRCWTQPELLQQWFVPQPWNISDCELDVRPGGSFRTVMRSPDGQEFPNTGVYLQVIPDRQLVFTDAFQEAWIPAAQAFMTVEVTFEPEAEQTRYTARAFHWTAADRDKHIEMGFHSGWNTCLDQLLELARTL